MTAWRVLAQGEHGVGVARCPEGHIHVELKRGTVTLRFDDLHFLAFAQTVVAAAASVAGPDWMAVADRVGDDRLSRN
jgi:hypothetical protein